MEASPEAAKALPSANRLGALSPGLAHVVHMPSHIYLRTGNYNKGIQINEDAIAQFKKYSSLFPAVKENVFIYLLHNQHMQVNCALMAGKFDYTKKAALELQQGIDTSLLSLEAPTGAAVQYIYATPILVDVHFEKWDEILQLPQPAKHHIYATILYHFSRGMAYIGQDNSSEAKHELNQLQALMIDPSLKLPFGAFSSAFEGAKVAEQLLQGTIALKEHKSQESAAYFENAVTSEENMVYNEPRDWILNPKQYAGKAYLIMGEWAKAEDAFRKDLKGNNLNVWSLKGLKTALEKQNKKNEASRVEAQLIKQTLEM